MLAELKGLNEECGVFGIWGHDQAPRLTYYGLHSLQHRGQEGAGIVSNNNGESLSIEKGLGLVNEVFSNDSIEKLSGNAAIGHVRYATAGGDGYENVQPLLFKSQGKSLALSHNGNLTNAHELRAELEAKGSIFQTSSDTEVLAHLLKADPTSDLLEQAKKVLPRLEGAFAFVMMTEDEMIVALDRHGFRPLSLGMLDGSYIVASETCALDIIGAEFIRDVMPGQILKITHEGLEVDTFIDESTKSICSMEYVYLSRPDSNIDGINVHSARKSMGKKLAYEAPVHADIVTGVPDSSISAAIGFAEASGISYEMGLIKNRYVGRTFIQPSQELRERGVKMKLSPVSGVVEGKSVVMVDDSIVRGTTSRKIVQMLRDAGAKEVHVRIGSPPIRFPCFYGIDTSSSQELIASDHSVEQICELIGADSLEFLSKDGMLEAIGKKDDQANNGQCVSCFTGQYVAPVPTDLVEMAQ